MTSPDMRSRPGGGNQGGKEAGSGPNPDTTALNDHRSLLDRPRPVRKPECGRGHSLTDVRNRRPTGRICRECNRLYASTYSRRITVAAHRLGMTRREYLALFGWSKNRAEAIIGSNR